MGLDGVPRPLPHGAAGGAVSVPSSVSGAGLSAPWAPSHPAALPVQGVFLAPSHTRGRRSTERFSNLPAIHRPAQRSVPKQVASRARPRPKGTVTPTLQSGIRASIVAPGGFWPEGICLILFAAP